MSVRNRDQPRRRPALAQILICAAVAYRVLVPAYAADAAKTLQIAQFDIDTLDPQQYSEDPSFQVIQALFEPAYEWDYLAKTPRLSPLTAAATPEITEDGKVWTVKLQHGIL